jgi:hypothetical protein
MSVYLKINNFTVTDGDNTKICLNIAFTIYPQYCAYIFVYDFVDTYRIKNNFGAYIDVPKGDGKLEILLSTQNENKILINNVIYDLATFVSNQTWVPQTTNQAIFKVIFSSHGSVTLNTQSFQYTGTPANLDNFPTNTNLMIR